MLRAYSLTFTRLGAPSDATRQRLIARFDPLFPAATRDLNIQLVNQLVYLQSPAIASKAMTALSRASTQEEQIEYVLALRALNVGWTLTDGAVLPLVRFHRDRLSRWQHICSRVEYDQERRGEEPE